MNAILLVTKSSAETGSVKTYLYGCVHVARQHQRLQPRMGCMDIIDSDSHCCSMWMYLYPIWDFWRKIRSNWLVIYFWSCITFITKRRPVSWIKCYVRKYLFHLRSSKIHDLLFIFMFFQSYDLIHSLVFPVYLRLFITGESIGMIDYNIWPHMEKIHSVTTGGLVNIWEDYKTR